ncbi:hypothetical protein [Brevibacillus borstelensis]|uniref:hypothetical protein n=1 Tax=Brevibacillus borstelensis TaxID=45462 RepID=UPI001D0B6D0D|nr:hypothetical protein [Brevibacillus borstelensis]MCC0566764.1 hypothetical protein [Brevibacillus borstelensis]
MEALKKFLKGMNKFYGFMTGLGIIVVAAWLILTWAGVDVQRAVEDAVSMESETTRIVKEGHFEDFPEKSIGEAFGTFFGSPSWRSFQAESGEDVVEFKGTCMFMDKRVNAVIQFIVNQENRTFRLYAVEFNDIPQNNLIQMALMGKVFEKELQEETFTGNSASASKGESSVAVPATHSAPPQEEQSQPALSQPTPEVSSIILADAATSAPLPSLIEWQPGLADTVLPLNLGGDQAELRLGLGHPNGIKCQVVLKGPSVGWELDISQADTSFDVPYDETGELREGFVMQAAAHDFDQDGTPEIVVTAGDGLLESYAWVFSYNKGADPNKINPFVQDLKVTGQTRILVEQNKLLIPFGSQGLYEEYAYVDKQFYKKQ